MPVFYPHLVESALLHPDVEYSWYDTLGSLGPSGKAHWDSCLDFIQQYRDELIRSLREVSDAEAQQTLIHLFFVRSLFHWTTLNTQIGYQFAEGKEDVPTILKAGLLADLCERLKPHVSECYAEQIQLLVRGPYTGAEGEDTSLPAADPLSHAVSLLRDLEDRRFRNPETSVDEDTDSPDVPDVPLENPLAAARWQELEELRVEKRLLQEQTGRESASEVVALVRHLEDELLEARQGLLEAQAELDEYHAEFGDKSLKEVALTMRTLSRQVTMLQQEISNLRSEQALTQAQLEREMDVVGVKDTLSALHALRDRAIHYRHESERANLFTEAVGRELGTLRVPEAVATVRMLKDRAADLVSRLAHQEMEWERFKEVLGTDDVSQIIEMARQGKSVDSLADVLGNMENALNALYPTNPADSR
ncbi:MAG: hypothetical protein OHK0029_20820 [Armatimonadaceae bacterium]